MGRRRTVQAAWKGNDLAKQFGETREASVIFQMENSPDVPHCDGISRFDGPVHRTPTYENRNEIDDCGSQDLRLEMIESQE